MSDAMKKTARRSTLAEDGGDLEDVIKLRVIQARAMVDMLQPLATRTDHGIDETTNAGFDLLAELLMKIERDADLLLESGRAGTPRPEKVKPPASGKKRGPKPKAKVSANGNGGGREPDPQQPEGGAQ